MLTSMFRRSPPEVVGGGYYFAPKEGHGGGDEGSVGEEGREALSRVSSTAEARPLLAPQDTTDEVSPLLGVGTRDGQPGGYGGAAQNGRGVDLEGQKYAGRRRVFGSGVGACVKGVVQLVSNPKRWDGRAVWRNVVVAPVACLPAVVVGLLFNILDALSYGEW